MAEIQSVQRAFRILDAVSQVPNGAQVGDVARLTGLPKSTISRMLTTLENIEAIQRETPHAGYGIGPTIAKLLAQPSWLVSLGEIPLQQLVEATGESATLSVMDGDRLLYITQKSDPKPNIQLRNWTGTHFSALHVSSPCKLFLAYDAALLRRYLCKPLERFTEHTIVDQGRLKAHLDQISRQGYAWVREEFEHGLAGVSAPVFGRNGKIAAAISLYGPSFRIPSHENEKEFSELVVKKAAEMTAHLAGVNS